MCGFSRKKISPLLEEGDKLLGQSLVCADFSQTLRFSLSLYDCLRFVAENTYASFCRL